MRKSCSFQDLIDGTNGYAEKYRGFSERDLRRRFTGGRPEKKEALNEFTRPRSKGSKAARRIMRRKAKG